MASVGHLAESDSNCETRTVSGCERCTRPVCDVPQNGGVKRGVGRCCVSSAGGRGVLKVSHVIIAVLVIICSLGSTQAQEGLENVDNEKVCQGTNHGLVARGDWVFRYNQYKDLYTNCTYVIGNLEIIFLDGTGNNFDLSFLRNIRQVTGYVLIVGVYADYLYLDNLQIIRGKTLYEVRKNMEQFSLFVALNYDRNDPTVGLKELRLTSLQEILNGKVFFLNNNQLCFENKINWEDLNPTEEPPVEFRFNSTDARRDCPADCDPACYSNVTGHRHCWGSGSNMCQSLTQGEACHPSCERRCYGKLPNQCCHQECAGGCSGPLKTDCMTCRNFQNDGECVPYCPPTTIYDNRQMMNIPNPHAKFAYGGICVKECPGFLLQDSGSCVRACPEGKHAKDRKNCEPCENTCPKTCKGMEGSTFLNALNIVNFTECTTVDGNLRILKNSFLMDPHYGIRALNASELSVLKHVREITGYLLIQSDDPEFTDLSFLSNLEVIHGRQLDSGHVLHIMGTHLRSLELTSLKRIANGGVLILGNYYLCYAASINWAKIFAQPDQKAQIYANKDVGNCTRDGEVCDAQCDNNGCWGKGPNKCLSCRNFEFEEEHLCLSACTDSPSSNLYSTPDNKCKRCHPECKRVCSGPNNTQCDECAHVGVIGEEDGLTRCLDKCPVGMYPDERNICQNCHAYCKNIGCTGPLVTVGTGGCNSCDVGIKESRAQSTWVRCLPSDTESCQDGFHMMDVSNSENSMMAGRKLCEPCHRLCETCSGPGSAYCETCAFFKGTDGYCVEKCPGWTFGDRDLRECFKCHTECRGACTGHSNSDCTACSNFKVFLLEYAGPFNCTAECPLELPYHVTDENQPGVVDNHNVCADDTHPEVKERKRDAEREERTRILIMVLPIVGGLLLLGGLLACFGFFCQRRARSKEKTAQLTAKMTGFDETEVR